MSRCRARNVLFNPSQLSSNGGHYALRLPESQRHAADVRTIQIQLLGNPGEKPRLHRNLENIPVDRGIFIGHNEESHNMALYNSCCNNGRVDMSSQKTLMNHASAAPKDWAGSISMFMKSLRLSQAGFAAKLNVTQQAVSNWLKGRREPAAEMYYRMTRLDPAAPEAQALLARAQILSRGFLHPDIKPANALVQASDQGLGNVNIPLLKSGRTAKVPIAPNGVERHLSFPDFFCAKAVGPVVCFRSSDDAMSPIIEKGCIVAIDLAQRDHGVLRNEMVAAFDPGGELTVRWLRKAGSDAFLSPQNVTREHSPVVIAVKGKSAEGWKIAGKLLWWIGVAI
jgi:DNA-binding transcriptional regulator YiaG